MKRKTRGPKQARLRLTIDLTYIPNGVPVADLKTMLENCASRLAGDGAFSGETEAEVENWMPSVIDLPEDLDEDTLAEFMSHRVENGEWDLEDLTVRLARFGLMERPEFIAEMRERMDLAKQ